MARYTAVQKDRRILDRAATLANNGVVAASAHDWPEATRQLKDALAECGDVCGERPTCTRSLASSIAGLATWTMAKRNCWPQTSSNPLIPRSNAPLT